MKGTFFMSNIKVVKFGGSSLADSGQFRKAADIVLADPSRRFVVASAPGKRFSEDIKITDMLYACYDKAAKGEDFTEDFSAIEKRYNEIISELGLDISLDKEFERIKSAFAHMAGRDYAASRGEYLNSKVFAAFLGFEFIDPAGYIKFGENGVFDLEKNHISASSASGKMRARGHSGILRFNAKRHYPHVLPRRLGRYRLYSCPRGKG